MGSQKVLFLLLKETNVFFSFKVYEIWNVIKGEQKIVHTGIKKSVERD